MEVDSKELAVNGVGCVNVESKTPRTLITERFGRVAAELIDKLVLVSTEHVAPENDTPSLSVDVSPSHRKLATDRQLPERTRSHHSRVVGGFRGWYPITPEMAKIIEEKKER